MTIAGLQIQLVIERSARLLRRAPHVCFVLGHPAATTVGMLRRGRKSAIRPMLQGVPGLNLVKNPRWQAQELVLDRYTLRVTAAADRQDDHAAVTRWRSCRRCPGGGSTARGV